MIEDRTRAAATAVAQTPALPRLDSFTVFCSVIDALEASLVPQTVKEIAAANGATISSTKKRLAKLIGSGNALRAIEQTGRAGRQFVYWRRKP